MPNASTPTRRAKSAAMRRRSNRRDRPAGDPVRLLADCLATEAGASPLFLLWRAALRGRELLEARIRHLGLRARHLGVLWILERGAEVSQQQIAALMGLDPSTLVFVLDEMEKMKLLRRSRSQRDRRVHLLAPTPSGRRLAAAGGAALKGLDLFLLAALSPKERRQLLAILPRLAKAPGRDTANE